MKIVHANIDGMKSFFRRGMCRVSVCCCFICCAQWCIGLSHGYFCGSSISFTLPDNYQAADSMCRAQGVGLEIRDALRRFYDAPVLVPANELQDFGLLIGLDKEAIPAEDKLLAYTPWDAPAIARFFKDYPCCIPFMPILSFGSKPARHTGFVSVNMHPFDSSPEVRIRTGITAGSLQGTGTARLFDTSGRWENVSVEWQPLPELTLGGGKISLSDEWTLLLNRFPSESYHKNLGAWQGIPAVKIKLSDNRVRGESFIRQSVFSQESGAYLQYIWTRKNFALSAGPVAYLRKSDGNKQVSGGISSVLKMPDMSFAVRSLIASRDLSSGMVSLSAEHKDRRHTSTAYLSVASQGFPGCLNEIVVRDLTSRSQDFDTAGWLYASIRSRFTFASVYTLSPELSMLSYNDTTLAVQAIEAGYSGSMRIRIAYQHRQVGTSDHHFVSGSLSGNLAPWCMPSMSWSVTNRLAALRVSFSPDVLWYASAFMFSTGMSCSSSDIVEKKRWQITVRSSIERKLSPEAYTRIVFSIPLSSGKDLAYVQRIGISTRYDF